MHKKFLSYIENEKLFTGRDKLLVAVSGGMDSMTLCELLRINEFNFSIAHFNHVTRNGESDLDEDFVNKYALKYNIPYFVNRTDINKIIEDEKGGNFQNVARLYRYKWLADLRKEKKIDYIATAHHHNDQIETFLFHFSRGTGLDGLTGMSSKQDCLVRPMLIFTRKEIESFVFDSKIDYRIDSSNSSNKYSRNYIRHGIIPSFKILNEHFESNANTTIENLRSTKSLYHFLLEKHTKTVETKADDGKIIISNSCLDIPENLRKQMCFEMIRRYGFNFSQACQITESIDQRGKTFYSETYVLLVEAKKFIIRKRGMSSHVSQLVEKTTHIPGSGTLFMEKMGLLNHYPKDKNIEYIDADLIEFPLLLRNKEDGDRFKPIGMKGRTKKIKDFFTDLKINKFEKEKALVLLNKDKVVWIIGYRLSEKFKITPKTKQIVRLQWVAD